MKFIIVLLLNFFAIVVFSQTDKMQLRIWYNYHQVDDTLKNTGFSERMRLDIGEVFSKYYSENAYLSDSIVKQQEASGVPMAEILAQRFSLPKHKINEMVFKNYPQVGKLTFYNKLLLEKYKYTEKNPAMQWKIASDTKEILGYKVQKATTNYAGREYTAWYTEAIPIAEGPWKFSGLPGLILELSDSKGYFTFKMIGLLQVGIDKNSEMTTDVLQRKNNMFAVDRKTYLERYLKFKSKPGATLESMGVKRVKVEGKPLKIIKPSPYNVMEKY